LATLPGLQKGVTKDPSPPATDTVLSPIIIPNGTTLVTTKTTNETIDNIDAIIDYISGDSSPNFIPQLAIDDLVSDLAGKEDSLGFTPENIVNKGATNGYAPLVSGLVPISNLGSGTPDGTKFLRDDGTFVTPSGGGIVSINSDTTPAQVIAAGTGLGIIDAGDTHTLSIDSTVVTLTGSQILINKTITAVANTLTIASTDLTDTANIAYLNTTNIYTAGATQFFVPDSATVGLNVGTLAGDPSGLNDGDIWLNSSTNQLFARINGVTVDLGASGGEIFTWTNNHSMATFKLTATAANDVILNAPTGQGVSIEVNAVQQYLFNATTANFQGNTITNIGAIRQENVVNPNGFITMENFAILEWENNVGDDTLGITVGLDVLQFTNGLVFGQNIFSNHPTVTTIGDTANAYLLFNDDGGAGEVREITVDDFATVLGGGGSGDVAGPAALPKRVIKSYSKLFAATRKIILPVSSLAPIATISVLISP